MEPPTALDAHHHGLLATALTRSNEYMKVQRAKLKEDQAKSGKKVEHKVG